MRFKFRPRCTEETKKKISIKAKERLSDHLNNPNWNGGIKMNHGYVYKWCKDHPFANKDGYVYEHRIVLEKKLGRFLNPEEKVHHLNHIKTDNRPENLDLVSNNREHILKFHRGNIVEAWKKAPLHNLNGRWSQFYDSCKECGTTSKRHEGRGYCRSCYSFHKYRGHLSNSLTQESAILSQE